VPSPYAGYVLPRRGRTRSSPLPPSPSPSPSPSPPAPRLNEKQQDGRSGGRSERNRATREKSERGKMVTRGPPFVTNVCFASLPVESFYIVSRSKSYLVPANIYTVIQLASPLITRQGTLMRLLILFHVVRFCISLFKHSPARVPISCIVPDE